MGIRPSLQNRGFRFAAAYGWLVWAAVMVAGTFRQSFVRDGVPDVPPWNYCPQSAGEANACSPARAEGRDTQSATTRCLWVITHSNP